jgi:transposase
MLAECVPHHHGSMRAASKRSVSRHSASASGSAGKSRTDPSAACTAELLTNLSSPTTARLHTGSDTVPLKSEQQQACVTLHRLRAQLMKMRIMQTNALRGLLYEFGIVLGNALLI